MKTNWTFPTPYPDDFGKDLSRHRYIKQYMWNKGYTDYEYVDALLHGRIPYDTNPLQMKDMEITVNRLWGAIRDREQIVVFGDYDADGCTSVTLLYLALLELGARVEWFAPSRDDGYGASPTSMQKVYDLYQPDVVITTDNGIKGEPAAAWAVEHNIDFLVTDHHSVDLEDNYPYSALSVVNPSQDDCPYPENHMAGVGVAYKVAHAMALWGKQMGYYNEPSLGTPDDFAYKMLDLVAVGSIADMMSMASLETRWMVREGIKQIRNSPRLGIQVLCEVGFGIDHTKMTATDIAFSISPKINASGRMDKPDHAILLLTSNDYYDCYTHATRIDELNNERKELQRDVTIKVFDDLSYQETSVKDMPIIIAHVDCPHGIVGLVAGDVSRDYTRPAIMMSEFEQDGVKMYTGSARSIVGINITDALSNAAHLMERYGGHAGEAGMTIQADRFDDFRKAMYEAVSVKMGNMVEDNSLIADVEVGLHELSDIILEIYEALEPAIGADFPMLSFVTCGLNTSDVRVWGKNNNHLEIVVSDDYGNKYKANGWFMGEEIDVDDIDSFPDKIDIAYTYEIVTYPYEHPRLKLEAWRPAQAKKEAILSSKQARELLGSGGRRRL